MTRATFAPLIGPEFDSFLSASIGDDPEGRRLSVLSAFARTDIDPWKETACLARMSREKATARLTEFISTIPDRPSSDIPAKTVASQLVALLPSAVGGAPPTQTKPPKLLNPTTVNFGFAFSAIALLVVLALMAFAAPKVGSRTNANPAVSTDHSATPPLALGQ